MLAVNWHLYPGYSGKSSKQISKYFKKIYDNESVIKN